LLKNRAHQAGIHTPTTTETAWSGSLLSIAGRHLQKIFRNFYLFIEQALTFVFQAQSQKIFESGVRFCPLALSYMVARAGLSLS
jgi:hypothetical protein